ncbi:LytR/AlgR family response regulator transcription factor [Mucilaginibacter polytrichastri]|uniref:Uncharacterized protein n=1 Tax=Mucilaginibacter polytrichastri TaxID=1302689 RepID=A0A1Q6A439_9SPHI|nr:LytTR family DNA-binding domain-containing protein [Mucilaginibacter polytrichastri]OKS88775.1 hypothetical protein RG47T_4253 [Mucilaginibacter polytrichastri]SFT05514.1 two component transcriptional regulator, LytTR family [Mucilaginibacter polytrichastri]
MKKINCLIADDEALARDILENYVHRLEKLNLTGTCANGAEVYNMLEKHAVDLVFLDIHMPHLTGIELLRTLKNPPAIVLTTAYREYALEGYELNVIDYLLKPISFDRFIKAIDRYESLRNPKNFNLSNQRAVDASPDGFIYVKSDKKMVRVQLKDILYIEGLKDYVKIHFEGKSLVTYRSLISFEEMLSANHFLRVHRSFIISLDHISAYSAAQIEIDKIIIPIGNSYLKKVSQKLNFQ